MVPPAASSTSDMYLSGHKWTEYTLFPQYIISPPWTTHVERLKASNALPAVLPLLNRRQSIVANMTQLRQISSGVNQEWAAASRRVSQSVVPPLLSAGVINQHGNQLRLPSSTSAMSLTHPTPSFSDGITVDTLGRDVLQVGIVFATNGGATAKRAEEAAQLFNKHMAGMLSVDTQNIAEFVDNWDDFAACAVL